MQRSIERHLPVGARVDFAVMLWRHDRSRGLSATGAALAVVVGAVLVGLSAALTVPLAAVAAASAVVATTERRLLVQTSGGLLLFRAGRVRRRALALLGPVSPLGIERTGTDGGFSEWFVDGQRYRAWPGSDVTIEQMVDDAR